MRDIYDEFAQEHADGDVTFKPIAVENRDDIVSAQVAGGSYPDMVDVGGNGVPQAAISQELVYDLKPYIDENNLQDAVGLNYTQHDLDGHIYAVHDQIESRGLWYNAALFEKAERNAAPVSRGEIVLATVKGDIHDIGKNIVRVLLENYGYTVLDLGRDVPCQLVADTAKEHGVKLVGLSALMTTTLGAMEETIQLVKQSCPDCKIVVGGAVLTADYAEKIGADFYAKDAMETVAVAKEVVG